MKTAQRLALATCFATLALIAVGALVRATGSGLGCPDWPTCHGGVVPPGDRGHEPLIEFSHRFVAGVVGLLVIATAVYAWRYFRHQPLAAWTAIALVPAVGLQGLLGAVTVWQELPAEIVATHLLTAMIILSMEAVVVVGMYRADPQRGPGRRLLPVADGQVALLGLALFAALLWIGGYMAESGASTACEGWPLCNGNVLPASDDQEITHMVHRYLAALLALPLAALSVMLYRRRREYRQAITFAMLLGGLYAAQVMVGAFNVWLTFPDALTVSHTAVAATIWLTLSFIAALALIERSPAPGVERRPVQAVQA